MERVPAIDAAAGESEGRLRCARIAFVWRRSFSCCFRRSRPQRLGRGSARLRRRYGKLLAPRPVPHVHLRDHQGRRRRRGQRPRLRRVWRDDDHQVGDRERRAGRHGGIVAAVADAVTVNAGPGDEIVLRGLTISATGSRAGIKALGFGVLHIENCSLNGSGPGAAGFPPGISATPAASAKVFIVDTIVRNFYDGILIGGGTNATIERTRLVGNGEGLFAAINSRTTIRESVLSGNAEGMTVYNSLTGSTTAVTAANNTISNNTSLRRIRLRRRGRHIGGRSCDQRDQRQRRRRVHQQPRRHGRRDALRQHGSQQRRRRPDQHLGRHDRSRARGTTTPSCTTPAVTSPAGRSSR